MTDHRLATVERAWETPEAPDLRPELERLIAEAERERRPKSELGRLLLAHAHVCARAGDFDTAEQSLDAGVSLGQGSVDAQVWIGLLNYVGFLCSTRGRTIEAVRPLVAALRGALQHGFRHDSYLAAVNLSEVLLDLGDPNAALLNIERRSVPGSDQSVYLIEASSVRIRALIALGRTEAVTAATATLRHKAWDRQELDPRRRAILDCTEAECARFEGRPTDALDHARRALEHTGYVLEKRNRLSMLSTAAWAEHRLGDGAAAESLAEAALATITEDHSCQEIETLRLCAEIFRTRDRTREAEELESRANTAAVAQESLASRESILEFTENYLDQTNRRDADLESGLDALKRMQSQMESARREAEGSARRLQAITDALPMQIAHVDRFGILKFANAQLLHDCGLQLESVLGSPLRSSLGGGELEPLLLGMDQALAGQSRVIEVRVHLPQGSRDLEVRWIPAVSGLGAYLVALDITEREERKRLERQLLRAQNVESLGVLASGVAHDFNNLLTGVIANLSLAEDEPEHPERDDAIRDALAAARRAARLTRQLLDYTGKTIKREESVDLNKLVDSTCSLLQPALPNMDRVRLELDPDCTYTVGDADQFGQVLMNLVLNACESLSPGDGKVTIRTGHHQHDGRPIDSAHPDPDLPSGDYVFVEVEDKGEGMDEETVRRVFDPFFTTKATGRGLGLASALGIVKAHRGRLLLQTRRGQGTSMRLLLPRVERSAPTVEAPQRRALKCQRVLLIDDDGQVRVAIRRTLESLGVQCVEAAGGAQGLQLFDESEPFDLVLLDLTMARMDGEEVLRHLRSRSDVRIVLMSGYSKNDAMPMLQGGGADDFLQKPISRSDLVELLS